MTNDKLLTMFNDLASLQSRTDLILPPRVSYAILRNVNSLQAIVQDIDKLRAEILEKYGKQGQPDEQGRISYEVPNDKFAATTSEINDLLSVDTPFDPITISLDSLENCTLSIDDMNKLYCIIQDSEG